ncbi:MAG: Pvc16 family protein [Burkholderiales bacterium]
MPTLDIALVTESVISLLQKKIPTYGVVSAAPALVVSPLPPDLLKGPRMLGFYLYHVREEAHTKAQDWPIDDEVPQRYKPMGVALYYVLAARCETVGEASATFLEQTLMGLALKTLRDFPTIDKTTTVTVGGTPQPVMAGTLGNDANVIRLNLQPVQHQDAVHYWTAGSQPMRLAAYYEVSATLIEPERPSTRRSRVLAYGVHTFVRGSPRIDGTRNTVKFDIPGESSPREIELVPAEVTYNETLTVFGTDLKGDRTTLLLSHRDLTDPLEVDAPWNLATDGQSLTVTVRDAIGLTPLMPGTYGAIVRTVARRRLPDGSSRDFEFLSNESAFAIAPRIDVVTVAAVGDSRIDGIGFDPALVTPATEVDLILGSERLTLRTTAGALAAGQFRVRATPIPPFILFKFPAGLASGDVVALRLIVRGAEAAPFFVTVP